MPKRNPTTGFNQPDNALAEILIAQRPWLQTVLLARLRGDQTAADDVLSNMYTELLRSPDKLDNVQQIAPWLYRIAVNRANDWLRQQQRTRSVHQRIADDPTRNTEIDDRARPPIDQLLDQERHQIVRDALKTLEADDVEILNLKYCHDWSYAQLDEHLGIGLNQIAHRLRTARNRLKTALMQTGHADEFRILEGYSK